jgi:hypothetical protein
LKSGGTAFRPGWNAFGSREIMMQIPQRIAKDIVPKMTSVQEIVKKSIIAQGSGEIEYHHQVLMIEYPSEPGLPTRATYYTPTWEDIMAKDWVLTPSEFSNLDMLVNEHDELSDRLEKMLIYMSTKSFFNQPKCYQEIVEKKYNALQIYLNVLNEDIRFESNCIG